MRTAAICWFDFSDPQVFIVSEAANGSEAVEICKKRRPDFIWMDIRMPVMDGMTATKHIRNLKYGKSVIISALTAHALKEEQEVILRAGFDDFVRKPYEENDIFETMSKHLNLRYVYKEKDRTLSQPKSGAVSEELHYSNISILPADLLQDLRQSVLELNMEMTLMLIDKVKEYDVSVAKALESLAKQLNYDSLLRILDGIDSNTGGQI